MPFGPVTLIFYWPQFFFFGSAFGWPSFQAVFICKLLIYGWFMVLNATFNNISVISWRSVLLVEETRVCGENHRSVAVILLLWNFIEIILKEKNKSSVPTEHCVLLNKHQGILNVVFSQININTSQSHFFKIKLFTEISPNKMA